VNADPARPLEAAFKLVRRSFREWVSVDLNH
jgi:hypothetical protein